MMIPRPKSSTRIIIAAVLSLCFLILLSPASAQTVTSVDRNALRDKFAPMELLLCFQGKGSCLPYDAGVLREAYDRLPCLRDGRTIVSGNSSGSIAAIYFCAYGFSEANVRYTEERLKYGNRDAVRNMEEINSKTAKLIRGIPTEISHNELREYVAFALGVEQWKDAATVEEIVRRSSAQPVHPCVIVACNREVLEDRHPEDTMFAGRLKEIDFSTMVVSWKPEVHKYYLEHPDRFQSDHPNLILGPDRRIGRSLTYFVDRSMFDLLSQNPPEERMADLRLMEDPSDMALAILASTSEPTYFDPVADPHPEKILTDTVPGDLGRVRKRVYNGGYITPLPAQDVRRMLPGLRVFGSGWQHVPLSARLLLKNWLLADCETAAQYSEWWADLETNPDLEFESHMVVRDLTGVEEHAFGLRRARECFAADQGLPLFVLPSAFNFPAENAIYPAEARPEMFTGDTAPNGKPCLKTQRGLGPLLSPPSDRN